MNAFSFGGCCHCDNSAVTLRSFAEDGGALQWEVENFAVVARSPDNTLWGWGLGERAGGYAYRTHSGLQRSEAGTEPGGSAWPAKTNPTGNTWAHVAIDLVKVTSDGTRTVLKPNFVERSQGRVSTPRSIWSTKPVVDTFYNPGSRRYLANDSGVVYRPEASALGSQQLMNVAGAANILVNDLQSDGIEMEMTIRAQVQLVAAGAGTNPPMWNFRRAGTVVQFPLYGTASEVIAALSALPGVDSVTATGGPCCVADMDIVITWDHPTYTFSHAWLTYTKNSGNNEFWDWTTGTPSMISPITISSFTSDNEGVLSLNGFRRRSWAASSSHPWNDVSTSNVWSVDPFAGMTQTNERTKVGASTLWLPVPISTGIDDVRDGVVLVSQTRSRTPVVEPSSGGMTTHATLDETNGSVIQLHDSHLNVRDTAFVSLDGEIAVRASQYGYTYQGGDEGQIPPPGNSYADLTANQRCHSGRTFATGTGNLFEPFALQGGGPNAVAGSEMFSVGEASFSPATPNYTYSGSVSTLEHRLTEGFIACRWTEFPVLGIVPAHRREQWYTYLPSHPSIPADLEFRYVHKTSTLGSVVKSTAWFSISATAAEVEAELQAWYGEPIAGNPTISIGGTVEAHQFQTQPFFEFMPLAYFTIRTDLTGAVFAPRGRVLGLETRNGTPYQQRRMTCMVRTTGVIEWQKDVGYAVSRYSPGETFVGGQACYADGEQVVVTTLCRAVLDPEPL